MRVRILRRKDGYVVEAEGFRKVVEKVRVDEFLLALKEGDEALCEAVWVSAGREEAVVRTLPGSLSELIRYAVLPEVSEALKRCCGELIRSGSG